MRWTGSESGSLARYVRVLADRPLNRRGIAQKLKVPS
jgi:hypothetical protein